MTSDLSGSGSSRYYSVELPGMHLIVLSPYNDYNESRCPTLLALLGRALPRTVFAAQDCLLPGGGSLYLNQTQCPQRLCWQQSILRR